MSTSKLFDSYELKNTTLKNRIVMAPMCMFCAGNDGMTTDFHLVHYTTRAVGGTGLILLEATAVESRGRISSNDLGIWSDEHIEGLGILTQTVKQYDAVIGIQLGHAGRKCEAEGEHIIGPSAIPSSENAKLPAAMTLEDITTVVESFRQGARRAVEAGFQVIEIHGAHGYLISQFLSPLSNHRTDDYGGSPENRVRILREVLAAVKQAIPADMPVIVRVSAEDYVTEGNHPEDLAQMLNFVKDMGIDLINVSSGGVVRAPIHAYPGYQIKFAETIKEITGLPIMAGGLITSPLMAEEILRNERADLIFLGRELLRNPYWPLQSAPLVQDEIQWPKQYDGANPKV